MEFSEQWKSLWPVSGVFLAPNLLTGPPAKPLGPLIFGPSPSSPPLLLFSSPSLSLYIPPPLRLHSLRNGLNVFLRDAKDDFVPSSVTASLLAAVLPESDGSPESDPLCTNSLLSLRCHDGTTLLLFFPTGDNADRIGFVELSLKDEKPEIRVDKVGDVFKQREGYRHPHHQITGMAVVSVEHSPIDRGESGDSLIQGHLLASTQYSVSWFRVETRVSDSKPGHGTPFLVSLGNQVFEFRVVHACWNPHFEEESAVLLENGEVYWINLDSKRGVRISVSLEGESGRWLSCEFGGQPWILIVASSTIVVKVDLRSKKGTKPVILAKSHMPDLYNLVHSLENDCFIAFCRASFNDFYFSVMTEHHLLLFDMRQPLVPALTWDHDLKNPCYVAMFQLSQLRPSDEYKWASESGFAILVGSFWNCEFSLFCYGPRVKGASGNSILYAWELPSNLPLSGRDCSSGTDLIRKEFLKEKLPVGIEWQQKKELLVGFTIVPNDILSLQSESDSASGFTLIRLMSSGKLEMQKYCASWNYSNNMSSHEEELIDNQDPPSCSWDQDDGFFTRLNYLNLDYLSGYLNGTLSNVLFSKISNRRARHKEVKIIYEQDSCKLVDDDLRSASPSVSDAISDVSFPISIHEIAWQRELSCLPSDILQLAYSRYSEVFCNKRESSFELMEFPSLLPHKQLPSFFLRKPSVRSDKWSYKARRPGDVLVGPLLPLPILLAFQHSEKAKSISSLTEGSDDDLLTHQCSMISQGIFPETSIAEGENCKEWVASQDLQDEKPFFIYAPQACQTGKISCNKTTGDASQSMDEGCQTHRSLSSSSFSNPSFNDEKFTTFIAGINVRPDGGNDGHEANTSEMFDDLSPVMLDIDSPAMTFLPDEQKIYKCLKKQFLKWQKNFKPYEDFCDSSTIPKNVQ